MSPDAVVAALHLFDRWALTLRSLAGTPPPEVPAVPGRRCGMLSHEIPTVAEDAAAREADAVAAEIWRTLAQDTEGGTHD